MRSLTNNVVIASPAQPGAAIHLNSNWIASPFAKITEDKSSPAGRVLLTSRITMTNEKES